MDNLIGKTLYEVSHYGGVIIHTVIAQTKGRVKTKTDYTEWTVNLSKIDREDSGRYYTFDKNKALERLDAIVERERKNLESLKSRIANEKRNLKDAPEGDAT